MSWVEMSIRQDVKTTNLGVCNFVTKKVLVKWKRRAGERRRENIFPTFLIDQKYWTKRKIWSENTRRSKKSRRKPESIEERREDRELKNELKEVSGGSSKTSQIIVVPHKLNEGENKFKILLEIWSEEYFERLENRRIGRTFSIFPIFAKPTKKGGRKRADISQKRQRAIRWR